MILITGATGTVGHELVKLLSEGARPVRALVPARDRARVAEHPNVEVMVGSFEDPTSLDTALRGVSDVYLVSPPGPHQEAQERAVVEACVRAQVRSVVKQSVLGADPDSPVPWLRANAAVERYLGEVELPHTVLRPNWFMQNLLGFAPLIASQGVFYLPMGEARISMIDSRDVAAAAAVCLLEEGHHAETYRLTGPTAVTFGEVAEALSKATGQAVRYMAVSPEEARRSLLDMGLGEWMAEASLKAAEHYRNGRAAAITGDLDAVLHRAPHSIDHFARDYAEVFREGALSSEQQLEAA